MKLEQELAIIRCTLDTMAFFKEGEEKPKYYKNSDLEKILDWDELSQETTTHCRKFLNARKEWGFLYAGLPLSIYDAVGSWGFFSENLLFMTPDQLDRTIQVCYQHHQEFEKMRHRSTEDILA